MFFVAERVGQVGFISNVNVLLHPVCAFVCFFHLSFRVYFVSVIMFLLYLQNQQCLIVFGDSEIFEVTIELSQLIFSRCYYDDDCNLTKFVTYFMSSLPE